MYKLTLLLLIINFGCNSNSKEASFSSLKNNKGIYGTATSDEIKELHEEGIKTEIIPWMEDKNN